ncbi:MAG: ABC transporter permease, partial [Sutterellaceae bacterium]|nr:ABC transporter permease [Sutterellaceae bacterium]
MTVIRDCIASIIEELGAMFSGKFVPYHKTALFVAALTAFLFSLVFGHSVVFEAPVAVIDLDRTATSARIIEKVNASNFIDVKAVVRNPVDPVKLTAHDAAVGVLVIPEGLEESLVRGNEIVRVAYFADYSNSAQNAEVLSELSAFMPEFGAEFAAGRLSSLGVKGNLETSLSALSLSSRELFNPTLQA